MTPAGCQRSPTQTFPQNGSLPSTPPSKICKGCGRLRLERSPLATSGPRTSAGFERSYWPGALPESLHWNGLCDPEALRERAGAAAVDGASLHALSRTAPGQPVWKCFCTCCRKSTRTLRREELARQQICKLCIALWTFEVDHVIPVSSSCPDSTGAALAGRSLRMCACVCVCVENLFAKVSIFNLQGDTACHWDCVQRSYQ